MLVGRHDRLANKGRSLDGGVMARMPSHAVRPAVSGKRGWLPLLIEQLGSHEPRHVLAGQTTVAAGC